MAPTLLDEPQDAPGAEAASRPLRIVEAVDGRDPVIQQVDQRCCDELSGYIAKLGDPRPYRRVLDHPPVVPIAPRCHVAVAVAGLLIGREQPKLLRRGTRGQQAAGEIAIGVANAPGRAGMSEAVDGDPHRHARGAAATGRPVGKAVAAAEPGTGQIIIK
jgi:hypothetical protein